MSFSPMNDRTKGFLVVVAVVCLCSVFTVVHSISLAYYSAGKEAPPNKYFVITEYINT